MTDTLDLIVKYSHIYLGRNTVKKIDPCTTRLSIEITKPYRVHNVSKKLTTIFGKESKEVVELFDVYEEFKIPDLENTLLCIEFFKEDATDYNPVERAKIFYTKALEAIKNIGAPLTVNVTSKPNSKIDENNQYMFSNYIIFKSKEEK